MAGRGVSGYRELSSELRAFARDYTTRKRPTAVPFVFLLLLMAIGVPGTFDVDLGSETRNGIAESVRFFFWLAPAFAAVFLVLSLVARKMLASQRGLFSRAEIETTLQHGALVDATVIATITNEGHREGPTFLRILVMQLEGQEVLFSAFESGLFERFPRGGVIKVLYHPGVPTLAIPAVLIGSPQLNPGAVDQ